MCHIILTVLMKHNTGKLIFVNKLKENELEFMHPMQEECMAYMCSEMLMKQDHFSSSFGKDLIALFLVCCLLQFGLT